MTNEASLIAAAVLGMIAMSRPATMRAEQPSVSYVLRLDSAQLGVVDVTMRVDHGPAALRLAMKVHPEYDAKYWRYVDGWRVEGSADDARAGVVRLDSTLWRATLPGGRGLVHYRVHVQWSTDALRRSWQPFMRATGGLINGPDFFVYLPDFARVPVTVRLELPRGWRIASALDAGATPATLTAPTTAGLLDSPILVGDLREWTFTDRGTHYHIVYWPLPDAVLFDTTSLIDGIRRLASSASAIFGSAPVRDYYFLLQDGASDALEHRASLTMGLPSSRLAHDPHALLPELAHEFFHTWNLVAIHPDSYGALSYQRAIPTSGLWMGEGVTLYYADLLLRRA
ncbi:MAG TPA: hypothetical protein VGG84_14910, partial [Gemmatimonadaceae bacterium]